MAAVDVQMMPVSLSEDKELAEMQVDLAGTADEDEDLYTRFKTLQRQLEFLEIQEEYIKEEQKNLKRELLRAQEEVKRIQSVPLVIGQFLEMVDANSGIVGSTTGSNYYVRILSTLNRELLRPSASVALHRHSNALVYILPPEADSSISLLGDNEKPDVTYQVRGLPACLPGPSLPWGQSGRCTGATICLASFSASWGRSWGGAVATATAHPPYHLLLHCYMCDRATLVRHLLRTTVTGCGCAAPTWFCMLLHCPLLVCCSLCFTVLPVCAACVPCFMVLCFSAACALLHHASLCCLCVL